MVDSTSNKQLSIAFGGYSIAGTKQVNEDAFAVFQPVESIRNVKGAVACLADGVSCSENAREASHTSVTTFIEDYLSTPESWDVKTSASKVLSSLNSWLFQRGQVSYTPQNGLVTTFSGIIFKSASAFLFHSGDSRIYRLRNQDFHQMTRDHCLTQKNGQSALTRALGMDVQLKMDYQQRSLQSGDVFLLSTDGVHDTLTSAELKQLIQDGISSLKEESGEGQSVQLENVARHIVEQSLAKGSNDNITCLLIKIINVPSENIDELHRSLTEKVIPPVLEPGVKIDEYTIIKVLYNGVRSHIYLAEHPRFRHPFVLKIPSQRFTEDVEYLEGFIREQWIGRRINHDSVMKIYEPDPDSKFLYHVCEYIPGQTLRQWMYDNPEPDLNVVRELVKQIIIGLRVLQRMGMIHRDLKPENLMMTADKKIKLIDFGTVQVSGLQEISSIVQSETPAGTADYIAPEYLLGEKGQSRSDIFSLGVIVYEMLCGKLPFKPPSSHQARPKSYDFWKYRSVTAYREDVPKWVDLALEKACSPKPSKRYQAFSELLLDIQTPNKELVQLHQSSPLMQRNPIKFWQCVSVVFLLVIIIQWAMFIA